MLHRHIKMNRFYYLKLHILINILTLFYINKLQTGCFMYNISRDLHPLNFANMFRMNSDVHSHNTRQRDHLHVIQHRTLTREGCIRIFGVKLCNAIFR